MNLVCVGDNLIDKYIEKFIDNEVN